MWLSVSLQYSSYPSFSISVFFICFHFFLFFLKISFLKRFKKKFFSNMLWQLSFSNVRISSVFHDECKWCLWFLKYYFFVPKDRSKENYSECWPMDDYSKGFFQCICRSLFVVHFTMFSFTYFCILVLIAAETKHHGISCGLQSSWAGEGKKKVKFLRVDVRVQYWSSSRRRHFLYHTRVIKK